jgi:hypothetical protein
MGLQYLVIISVLELFLAAFIALFAVKDFPKRRQGLSFYWIGLSIIAAWIYILKHLCSITNIKLAWIEKGYQVFIISTFNVIASGILTMWLLMGFGSISFYALGTLLGGNARKVAYQCGEAYPQFNLHGALRIFIFILNLASLATGFYFRSVLVSIAISSIVFLIIYACSKLRSLGKQ